MVKTHASFHAARRSVPGVIQYERLAIDPTILTVMGWRFADLLLQPLPSSAGSGIGAVRCDPRTNYSGGDGKLAQARSSPHTSLQLLAVQHHQPDSGSARNSPDERVANPAYCHSLFFQRVSHRCVGGNSARHIRHCRLHHARCVRRAVVPSAIGAQLSIILFAPTALFFSWRRSFAS